MKEMTEETILSILDAITPDTSWYGESNRDRQSLCNLGILEDMMYQLYEQLTDNMDVGLKHEGSASASNITKKKYCIVKMFHNAFRSDKLTLEREMNKPIADDDDNDGTMADSKALQIAIDYISKRISELREADDATNQDDPKHNKIIDELSTLMQVRTALSNMEIDKEDEENN